MIKALVFDLDDTLYNEIDYIFSGYKMIDRLISQEFEKEGFYVNATNLFKSGDRKRIFNKVLDMMEINYDYEMINYLVDRYRCHEPSINLLEDTKWIFRHLSKDVKLGLISDGYLNSQVKKIEALNIRKYFHSIILSDKFGIENWKPSPFPYEKIVIDLDCENNECVYIGDNLMKDFITPKKLGWTTVHLKRGTGIYADLSLPTEYQAHFQISDLKELINIPNFYCCFNYQNYSEVKVNESY